ncbi:hypothetical protein AXX17_AT5G44880 [Arabidopsis thaliana]|jgi:hypothetical protein|uniref:Uncharacterized protein n=1 Tax=Arabidopsis thaliana TaxID=3702 RepID=A0A178UPG2_ARATH|nr:hypothetical protein AXX17_AT5G44880 [Arabidopsis thaliana]
MKPGGETEGQKQVLDQVKQQDCETAFSIKITRLERTEIRNKNKKKLVRPKKGQVNKDLKLTYCCHFHKANKYS